MSLALFDALAIDAAGGYDLRPVSRLPVTAEFLLRLRTKLDEPGETRRRLASVIGASAMAITRLLGKDPPKHSKLVGPICQHYGWGLPRVTVVHEDTDLSDAKQLVERLALLSDGEREAVVRLVEALEGAAQKSD